MFIVYTTVLLINLTVVFSYNNKMFTLTSYDNMSESQCGVYSGPINEVKRLKINTDKQDPDNKSTTGLGLQSFSFVTIKIAKPKAIDPLIGFERIFHQVLYAHKGGQTTGRLSYNTSHLVLESHTHLLDIKGMTTRANVSEDTDYLAHYPTGQYMRAETFQDKSSVHLPFLEYMHRGHAHLKITKDYMQTAVDAFAIFIAGDLSDIERLPATYVLQSARTIAMMRIAREKLAATWSVVKGSTPTEEVTYETLELYRPLFKHINGKEMARLNLMDDKILSYIGTHPDLNRHQVGVVASKYIQLNPRWTDAKYLNMMNNLLCGVPMIFMRRIPENTYLQLTHQIFYHIRACDPLQRRFYLAMMMRTQALGKSYSWSAREVSRLGLLLAEVSGQDLSAINPEAMLGITAQVMLEMPIHNLKSITEMQLRYLDPKPLNILARKLIAYQNQQLAATGFAGKAPSSLLTLIIMCILFVIVFEKI